MHRSPATLHSMSGSRLAVVFLFGFSAVLIAPSAWAQVDSSDPQGDQFPLPTHPFRVEALGGGAFGDTSLPTGESVNAYGAGFSVRGAYVLDFGLSMGLRYDHFFGTTSSYPLPLVALVEYQTGASFLAADAGFELALSHALFRPHVGLGAVGLRKSVKCSPVDGSFGTLARDLCADNENAETDWGLGVAPGLLMGLGWGKFYGFADLSYLFREPADAFLLAGGVGVTL